jgi:hypothetical protein
MAHEEHIQNAYVQLQKEIEAIIVPDNAAILNNVCL